MENIRPIRTEADYDWALAEIAPYFSNEPRTGSAEADRFDVLAGLIEGYESKHWAIELPDPVDAIRHSMEMKGLTQADLAEILGSRPRASEILNRKRALTLQMIQLISSKWHIPAEILIRPYHLELAD